MRAKKSIKDQLVKYAIDFQSSIHDALKQMDNSKAKLLIVLKENKFFSIVSVGDIQRAIIADFSLDTSLEKILRPGDKIKIAAEDDSVEQIKSTMLTHRIEFMPRVSDSGEVVDILFWDQLFDHKSELRQRLKDVPVVVMAGGKGTRLRPLTAVLPKPLLPIGDEPILTKIMDTFKQVGSTSFYISVNYMHEIIRAYYKLKRDDSISLDYVMESKPLGTAGSLTLLKDKIDSTFFVSNCDILIDQDYGEVLEYHKSNGNLITIVSALKQYSIPYGTLNVTEGGLLESLSEKPNLNYMINTGVYVIEPEALQLIPENEFFHITHLIEKAKELGNQVGVFPVSEKSWTDIGEWESYSKFLERSI